MAIISKNLGAQLNFIHKKSISGSREKLFKPSLASILIDKKRKMENNLQIFENHKLIESHIKFDNEVLKRINLEFDLFSENKSQTSIFHRHFLTLRPNSNQSILKGLSGSNLNINKEIKEAENFNFNTNQQKSLNLSNYKFPFQN